MLDMLQLLPKLQLDCRLNDILQITVPGTYNGVPFAVNEGAMVMDADNGLVAPMVYESVIQPVSYELLIIGVGPLEEYKSLKTLHTELINKGIFAKFLYIVYKDTTIEDSLDLSFPTCQGVIILTDTGLNNVVTNNSCYLTAQGTNTHGILFEGEWHLGTFIARNLRLGGKIYASTSMDIINLECISSTAELHLNSGSYQNGIQITNFHSFTPIIQSTPTRCKFFCNNGTEYGNIVLRGTTEAYTLETNGCAVVLKGGNHKFGLTYNHINDTFVNPHQVVLVTEMATCFASIAVPNPNAWADIPRGIELVSGLVTAPSITGSVTTAYSQTPGTITSNGIIFG